MTIKEKLSENQKRKLYYLLDLLPDKVVLHLQYYASLGRRLNLKNPQRFTEKMQWYKLNYRNDLMTICSDKYMVRKYVSERRYQQYLPELYGVYDDYSEINFDKLPQKFAIKCNNGSGTNIFVTNKASMNLVEIEEVVKSWKQVNTLSIGREWVYKNIPQKIIIEELLEPEDQFQKKNGLNDYKILCFNGVAKYIWVDVNRSNNHSRNFFDLEWNQLEVKTDKPLYEGHIEKPEYLNKMIEIATKFSKDFPFVRVDFYVMNNKIYIGELTFYPWSGCVQFEPDEFDYVLGKELKLQ